MIILKPNVEKKTPTDFVGFFHRVKWTFIQVAPKVPVSAKIIVVDQLK